MLAGSIAAIVLSGIAIASMARSDQAINGEPKVLPPEAAAVPAARPARAYRCAECGVIESVRLIEASADTSGAGASGRTAAGNHGAVGAAPSRNYEITVRLQNGTMRMVRDAKAAHWRHGEPVTIIAGADR